MWTDAMEHHALYKDHDYAGDRARFPVRQALRRTGCRVSVSTSLADAWYMDLKTGWVAPQLTRGMVAAVCPRYWVIGQLKERVN